MHRCGVAVSFHNVCHSPAFSAKISIEEMAVLLNGIRDDLSQRLKNNELKSTDVCATLSMKLNRWCAASGVSGAMPGMCRAIFINQAAMLSIIWSRTRAEL